MLSEEQRKEVTEQAALAAVEAYSAVNKRSSTVWDIIRKTLTNVVLSALTAAFVFIVLAFFKDHKENSQKAKDLSQSSVHRSEEAEECSKEALDIAENAEATVKRLGVSLQVVQDRLAIVEADISDSMVPRARPVTLEAVTAKKKEIAKEQATAINRELIPIPEVDQK